MESQTDSVFSLPEGALCLLIGLPGSGKSVTARRICAQYPQHRLIATDAIRARLFGDEAVQGEWLRVWQEVDREFRQAVQQIRQGTATGAIYDATNAVSAQRKEAIALARSCGFTLIWGLWLDVSLEVCLARNKMRDRQVPEAVILHIHRCLHDAPPSQQDGLDRLIIV